MLQQRAQIGVEVCGCVAECNAPPTQQAATAPRAQQGCHAGGLTCRRQKGTPAGSCRSPRRSPLPGMSPEARAWCQHATPAACAAALRALMAAQRGQSGRAHWGLPLPAASAAAPAAPRLTPWAHPAEQGAGEVEASGAPAGVEMEGAVEGAGRAAAVVWGLAGSGSAPGRGCRSSANWQAPNSCGAERGQRHQA